MLHHQGFTGPQGRAAERRNCCWRREEEAGEAIGRTAKNRIPTGRPQRRGKDAPWGAWPDP